MMNIRQIRQVEYTEAPDSIKNELIKNQIIMHCDYSPGTVDDWIEEILNPWMDENVTEGFYSIDIFRKNATEPTNVNNILFKKYSRKKGYSASRSIVIIRFTDQSDMKKFKDQCAIWKLSN